jgi:hypothetical protein
VSVFRVAPSAADPVVNTPVFTFQPFGARFAGGASVAAADVGTFVGGVTRNVTAADGRSELVVASLTPVELLAPPTAYFRSRAEVMVAFPPFQLVNPPGLTVKLTLTGIAAS